MNANNFVELVPTNVDVDSGVDFDVDRNNTKQVIELVVHELKTNEAMQKVMQLSSNIKEQH